ncbi:MAG: hypothetical protein II750_08640 [Bacteroidaceae bacterium]|nr:hypothetical protein [Bacteroidaceae bacterium]
MKTNVYIKDHLGSNRMVVNSIDEVTDTAVSQTIGHITATANTVQTDISTLPDGSYTLSIVPQTGDDYEGESPSSGNRRIGGKQQKALIFST